MESGMVAGKSWERGIWGEYCSMDIKFQFYKMETATDMNSGDSHKILLMDLIPLNCTLKNV